LGKRLTYGKNVYFGKKCTLDSPNHFSVGNNFSVGERFFVQTNVVAKNDCLISSNVSFVGNDHNFYLNEGNAYWSGKNLPDTVILDGNNFIGYGAIIVGSVKLNKGAKVAAGAVVVKDVPEGVTVGGSPAKPLFKVSE
jgi:chloramphenicol O-acetyltransferase type B